MSGEKTFEQRFAEIYSHLYATLKSEEAPSEEEWQMSLAIEANLQEETLTPVQKDFFVAIRASDLNTVSSLIDQEEAKPDFKLSVLLPSIDYWQMTNLLHPAQPHFLLAIRDVIWNLIISHSEEHTFDELLRWAIVFYQSDNVMQEFIDDLNSVDAEGLTPLHLACFFNQESTVAFLLAQEAEPLNKDKAGNLPLHFACANNHLGIVMRLLNAMTDRSCITGILENTTVHSADIKETLQLYSALFARSSEKKPLNLQPIPLSKLAAFVKKNGIHKPNPGPQTKRVQLEPDLTAQWQKDVKEAEAKKLKLGK